jgi:hypothetical protein
MYEKLADKELPLSRRTGPRPFSSSRKVTLAIGTIPTAKITLLYSLGLIKD